jgi:hypothetical protein
MMVMNAWLSAVALALGAFCYELDVLFKLLSR